MRRSGLVLVAVGLMAAVGATPGDEPRSALVEARAMLDDASIPVEERARRALDAAGVLDVAAQQATTAATRRARWAEAVGLLDETLAKHPGVDSAPLVRFQAGVYAWASARTFVDQADLAPGDASARSGAVAGLDDALRRLSGVAVKGMDAADPFAQNVRFRQAQAIADRARLDADGEARTAAERRALTLLDQPITAAGLRGFARLLKAELSTRLGLYGQAQIEIEEAEKADPPPPVATLVEAKVATLCGRRLFDDARKLAASAKVDDALKGLLALRTELARRRDSPPGSTRVALAANAFPIAMALRTSTRPEARRGLMELAREVDEPGPDAPPDWWDILAEGHLRLGNPSRAGRLEAKGADRAEAIGRADVAASLRFKAAACLFEGEKFDEADRLLTRVVDSKAARELRARAGMLRAMSRGRALAGKQAGATRESYLSALEGQVRDFGDESSTGEARWLLGKVRLAAGRRDEATALWSGIKHGHPRWLEATLAVADIRLEDAEDQHINHDSVATRAKAEKARTAIKAGLDAATEGSERVELGLRQARLELVPDAGNPADALDACDKLLKAAARPDQHRQARLYRMVALARTGRFQESEQVARQEAKAVDVAEILPFLRLLDRSASEGEADQSRRRSGLVIRAFTTALVTRLDQFPPAVRDEVRLRNARSLLLTGDVAAARRELIEWGGAAEADDLEFLRDLADTYLRIEAFGLAVDVERLRASRLAPNSIPWFEARYGLALACYRSGRGKEAARIIDGTALLHPELGGGELRGKFDRLRQRIAQE